MLVLLLLHVLVAGMLLPTTSTHAQVSAQGPVNQAFADAAAEFDVPRDLLVTIGYAETHFDNHNGAPSMANGYGMLHLVENNQANTLGLAAHLLGVTPDVLKTNPLQNIRGGAAVLRRYADEHGLNDATRKNIADWYSVVARYSNATSDVVAQFYADEAYKLLNSGFSGQTPIGETISVSARPITPKKPQPRIAPLSPDFATLADPANADLAEVLWAPAHSNNYSAANRPSEVPIRYIIIHTTQGSFSSALNWFQNASAGVSAHYTIRSSDGQIAQSVSEKNIAYHAGNWTYNTQSVGIEHEGYVSNGSWYTDAMYRSSAALTRSIAQRYNIPMDRSHIIGHNEVPGATHTDPGRYWNWTYYMQLVKGSWSATIDNTTTGRFAASSNWSTSAYSSTRYGANYHYTTPKLVSDAAWFKASLPATANYEVLVWYPASDGYNSKTPFVIKTTSGNKVVHVNQQEQGGQWVSLGTFNLAGGDYNVVAVSRYTSTPGYVVADAVKLVRR
jgi:N-acetyl-anhydromuramyl-L-alanine amidase AmpD